MGKQHGNKCGVATMLLLVPTAPKGTEKLGAMVIVSGQKIVAECANQSQCKMCESVATKAEAFAK